MEEFLEIKPQVQFIVLSDKFQMEDLKINGSFKPPLKLEKSTSVKSLIEIIEDLTVGKIESG